MSPERGRLLRGLLVCGLALGAWRGLRAPALPALAPDPSYAERGEALLHGLPQERVAYRLPASSMLAALLYNHAGVSAEGSRQGHALLEALLILAISAQLGALALLPAAGLLLVAARGSLLPVSGYPESAYALQVLWIAGILVWRARAPSWQRSLVLASAIGTTLLFRSTLAFFLPCLVLIERPKLKGALILLLVPYLFLVPWMKMNWTLSQRLVPFEQGAADINIATAAIGRVEAVEGDWRELAGDERDSVLLWSAAEIARRPWRYLEGLGLRLWFVLRLQPLLLLLAVGGAWLGRRRPEVRPVVLLAAYFLAIHCLMAVAERYFEPLWPLAALLAAWPLAWREPRAGGRLGSQALLWAGLALQLSLSGYAALKAWGYPSSDVAQALARAPQDAWLLAKKGGIEALTQACALRPKDRDYALQLAWLKMLEGDPGPLRDFSVRPDGSADDRRIDMSAEFLRAHAASRAGQRDQARRHLAALRDETFVLGVYGRLERRPPQERLEVLDLLLESWPRSAGLWNERSVVCAQLGRHPEALRALARAEALKPGSESTPQALRQRAGEYERRKDPLRAAEALEALSRSFPLEGALWIRRAQAALDLGRHAEVVALLARCETLALSPAERRKSALLYQSVQEHGRALAILERLSAETVADARMLNDLGLSLYFNGRLPEARAKLKQAMALDPRYAPAAASLEAMRPRP